MKNQNLYFIIILTVPILIFLFMIGLLLYNVINIFDANYISKTITFMALSFLQIFIFSKELLPLESGILYEIQNLYSYFSFFVHLKWLAEISMLHFLQGKI